MFRDRISETAFNTEPGLTPIGGILVLTKWISLRKDQLKVGRSVFYVLFVFCALPASPLRVWNYPPFVLFLSLSLCDQGCHSSLRFRSHWLQFSFYGMLEVLFSPHGLFILWCFWLWPLFSAELYIIFVSQSIVVFLFLSVTLCVWICFCSFSVDFL